MKSNKPKTIRNLIPSIRFQITECITTPFIAHLQGRGVVDHDGIPHLQPWSKFQHPTQLFNPPSRSHLDDFHPKTQTVGLFWDSSFNPMKISLPWPLSSFVKKSDRCFTEVGTRPWTSSQSLQWVLLIVCKAWCGNNLSIFCWSSGEKMCRKCESKGASTSDHFFAMWLFATRGQERLNAQYISTTKMVR